MRLVCVLFFISSNYAFADLVKGYELLECKKSFCMTIKASEAELSVNRNITVLKSLKLTVSRMNRNDKIYVSEFSYIDHELGLLIMKNESLGKELMFDLNLGELISL